MYLHSIAIQKCASTFLNENKKVHEKQNNLNHLLGYIFAVKFIAYKGNAFGHTYISLHFMYFFYLTVYYYCLKQQYTIYIFFCSCKGILLQITIFIYLLLCNITIVISRVKKGQNI